MFGPSAYLVGYSEGRSAAEDERETDALFSRVIYGRRPVTVDQSYIDQLHAALEKANTSSDHNYDAADRFRNEALQWRAYAQSQETLVSPLKAQVTSLQAQLAERDAALDQAQQAIAQERAAHQTAHEKACGLNRFRLMATWLINAHIAGRSGLPEFAKLRDMAKDVTDAIERGEPFRGYRDEPDKKERLRALLKVLLRP